ncbi:glycosyltransferase [Arenicella chitinivorans]|nr:glycosyltransferase [Arenicella chitinivorans]
MPREKRLACLVVGMHRSGTSVLSGMVAELGATQGKTMMAAKPENPKGFWENELVVQLNDQILHTLGARWDIPLLEPWDEHLDFVLGLFSERAKTIIVDDFNHADFISLKDPRIANLLPFWKSVLRDLGYEIRMVQIVRAPIEVFQSINKRNGFTHSHSDTLWLDSISACLDAPVDEVLLINHESLHTLQESVVTAMSQYLQLPESGVPDALAKFSTQCYDPGLRHFSKPAMQPALTVADSVYALLEVFQEPTVLSATELGQLRQKLVDLYSKHQAFKDKLEIYLTAISSVDCLRHKSAPDQRPTSVSARVFSLFEATLKVDQGESDTQVKEALERATFDAQQNQALMERINLLETNLAVLDSASTQKAIWAERRYQRASRSFLHAVKQRRDIEEKISEIEGHYHKLEEHFYSIDTLRSDLADWKGMFTEQALEFGRRFDHVLEQVWQTTRWKMGDRIVELLNKLVGRQESCESKEVLARIQSDYRHWGESLAKDYLPPVVDGLLEDAKAQSAPIIDADSVIFGTGVATSKDAFVKSAQARLDAFLQSQAELDFSFVDRPDLSVILVLYNRAELTLPCLEALLANNDSLSLQLIIIDNDSSDQTAMLLERVVGADIIVNQKNVGFLRACNQALELVKAEQTLFLNNDAFVSQGAVERAYRALQRCDNVGAVGARIVALDGLLQEAGSTCWSNGTCFGYGRGEDPNSFKFLFEREVDYCSGAFLQTKTNLLKQFGGFDDQFAPAYYEDTDYCLTLNENGLKVLYDPQVVVRHYEFGGSEGSGYAIELSNRNQKKFLVKHRTQLAGHKPAESGDVDNARFASAWPAKKILYIDDRVPHMYFGSGFPRSNFIVNCLAGAGYRVSILPLNFPNEESVTSLYSDIDRRIEVIPSVGRPEFMQFWDMHKGYYDLVWVSRPHNMEFVHPVMAAAGGIKKVVYDAEAIYADREHALRNLGLGNSELELTYDEMVKNELVLAASADALVAVSRRDRDIIASNIARPVPVIDCGYGVKIRRSKSSFEVRSGLLFVGNLDRSESPNVDSLLWFYDLVWPLVKKQLPNITLHVVGSNQADVLECVEDPNIVFHGVVDDLYQFYDAAAVFIAPTRYAAGIPLKVQEAAANGLPTVVTDLLTSQLGWQNERETLSSEVGDPCRFAENCVRLHSESALWRTIQDNAFTAVQSDCDVAVFENRILTMLRDVLKANSNVTLLSKHREYK